MPNASLKSKQKKYIVALRQLALTAPGGRMSLIEAVGLLQNIVPTDNTAIYWLNKQSDVIVTLPL